jgi:putative resolvase
MQCRIMSDPGAKVVIVERHDRPVCLGVEYQELRCLPSCVVIAGPGAYTDDRVVGAVDVLTSCARLYRRRGERSPATWALTATTHGSGEAP